MDYDDDSRSEYYQPVFGNSNFLHPTSLVSIGRDTSNCLSTPSGVIAEEYSGSYRGVNV